MTRMKITRFTVRLLTAKANAKLVLGLKGTSNVTISTANAIAIAASTTVDTVREIFIGMKTSSVPRGKKKLSKR